MDPQEDPEARIRQLEQPLADAARTSELGTTPTTSYTGGGYVPPQPPPTYIPPPPGSAPMPPPTFGASYPPLYPQVPRRVSVSSGFGGLSLVIAGIVLAVMVGIGAVVFFTVKSSVPGGLTSIPSIPDISIPSIPPTPGAGSPSTPAEPTTPAPGTPQSVSGMGENKTLVCNDGPVSVSGVSNTVTITGHCTKIAVSGMQNQVTLDSADVIGASGLKNVVIYHSGSPDINAIDTNVVQQG
jgi:hypothetical protein